MLCEACEPREGRALVQRPTEKDRRIRERVVLVSQGGRSDGRTRDSLIAVSMPVRPADAASWRRLIHQHGERPGSIRQGGGAASGWPR
jgi:hypothetical protein